jgi:ankyrin repeat protein
MKKIRAYIHIPLIIVLLYSTCIHAMKKKDYLDYLHRNFTIKADSAKKHNDSNHLIILNKDVFNQVIAYCHVDTDNPLESFEKTIATFMKLSSTCTYFKKLLSPAVIGVLCQSYPCTLKIEAFNKLLEPFYNPNQEMRLLPALIVLHTDTTRCIETYNLDNLLIEAVKFNNLSLAGVLFEHHANPNVTYDGVPLLFRITSLAMAQMFIKNNVNVHMCNKWPETNILWELLQNKYPAELLELYLNLRVDATQRHPNDDSCLLHRIAQPHALNNNFFKKTALLLKTISELINTRDQDGQTPLDIAQKSLKKAEHHNGMSHALTHLIIELQRYNAKTAQELYENKDVNLDLPDEHGDTSLIRATKDNDITRVTVLLEHGANADIYNDQRKKALDYASCTAMVKLLNPYTTPHNQPTCISCLSVHESFCYIPCAEKHIQPICIECYDRLPIVRIDCPLCHTSLRKENI